MHRRHRIEQVREARCAMLKRGYRVVIRAKRMAELNAHTARGEFAYDVHVPGDFGRQRDDADGVQRQILDDFVEHRDRGCRRLGTELARIDVRTLQMHAQQSRSTCRSRAKVPRPAITDFSCSRGAVIVVTSKLVVPWRAWARATVLNAVPPSITSAPPPPCTCRPIKPGRMYGLSLRAGSVRSPSIVAMRPSTNSNRPSSQPSGVKMFPQSMKAVYGPLAAGRALAP